MLSADFGLKSIFMGTPQFCKIRPPPPLKFQIPPPPDEGPLEKTRAHLCRQRWARVFLRGGGGTGEDFGKNVIRQKPNIQNLNILASVSEIFMIFDENLCHF